MDWFKNFKRMFVKHDLLGEYDDQIKKEKGSQVKVRFQETRITEQETYLSLNPDLMPFASLLNDRHNCNVPKMFKDAFAHHFGLVVTPDLIHRCLMYTMSSYMKHCSEDLRDWIVFHKDKKTLIVYVTEIDSLLKHQNELIDQTSEVFDQIQSILTQFNNKIMSDVKDPEFVRSLQSNYSTTTPTELLLNKLEIMNQLQQYYAYSIQIVCGLPFVIVKGRPDDWQAMLDKLAYLKSIFMGLAKKNATADFDMKDKIEYQKIDSEEYIKIHNIDGQQNEWIERKLYEWRIKNPAPDYEILDDPTYAEWLAEYKKQRAKFTEEFLAQASDEFKTNHNKKTKLQLFDSARQMYNYLVDLENIAKNILLTRTDPTKTKEFWNQIYSRKPRSGCGGPNYYEDGWLFDLIMETKKDSYGTRFDRSPDMLGQDMEIRCDVEIGNKNIEFRGGFMGYKVVKVGNAYALEGITELKYKFTQ